MNSQTSVAPWILKDPMTNEQAERIISTVARRSLSPSAEAWLRGDELPTGPVLSNAYQQVVWVYRAINILAEQIANIPFLFSTGERGRETLITSGPLHDFYARPHPQINRFQYWELRIMWLMLRGECMRVPIYQDSGGTLSLSAAGGEGRGEGEHFRAVHQLSTLSPQPRRVLKKVLILDPANFQHVVEDHQLLGWRYTGFGSEAPLASQVFLPEEVWFEKLPNPFDFWRGMSPLYTAETASRTDFAASSFMKGLMENNADVGLIVRTDQQLSKDQRAQLFAELRNRKRRAGTADHPLILWGGAQVIRPELSSADLQFLENRRFSRGEICAAFGVPEEIVSTTANSQYDVMAGARQNFIENRIAPLCSRLEAEENVTTIPAILGHRPRSADLRASSADLRSAVPQTSSLPPSTLALRTSDLTLPVTGWFDLDSLPIMQLARRNRLATAKTGFDMGIPFNELNRVFDLGFKPLPWGDTGYLPTKYQPLPQGGAGVPPASARAVPAPALAGPKSDEGGLATPKSDEGGSSFSQSVAPNSKPKTQN